MKALKLLLAFVTALAFVTNNSAQVANNNLPESTQYGTNNKVGKF